LIKCPAESGVMILDAIKKVCISVRATVIANSFFISRNSSSSFLDVSYGTPRYFVKEAQSPVSLSSTCSATGSDSGTEAAGDTGPVLPGPSFGSSPNTGKICPSLSRKSSSSIKTLGSNYR